MATRFYIVRHGESVANRARVCLGHTDLDMTELGFAQAEATANELKDIHFDAIYSSDLIRAYHTAVPHARLRGYEIIATQELREIYVGDWENCAWDDIRKRYAETSFKVWVESFGNYASPNGDTVKQTAERIEKCLAAIGKKHPDATILIASHAAAIRAFWGRICGYSYDELGALVQFPTNASYSVVDFDGEAFTPISYSCDEHLANLQSAVKTGK